MIDGTKFEANANKMTFFWGAWVKRYRPRHWQKAMEIVRPVAYTHLDVYKRQLLSHQPFSYTYITEFLYILFSSPYLLLQY